MSHAVEARDLLRSQAVGALATHSLKFPGYPYPSALPYACDAAGSPLFLISRLAEHTKNLLACDQVGLLVSAASTDVWEAPRLTLLGQLRLETDGAAVARFLRYHPQGARCLELADFACYRLQIQCGRYIAGFGGMGWLEGDALNLAPPWPAADEPRLLAWAEELVLADMRRHLGAEARVLGLDAEGLDLHTAAGRRRLPFGPALGDAAELPQRLAALFEAGNPA